MSDFITFPYVAQFLSNVKHVVLNHFKFQSTSLCLNLYNFEHSVQFCFQSCCNSLMSTCPCNNLAIYYCNSVALSMYLDYRVPHCLFRPYMMLGGGATLNASSIDRPTDRLTKLSYSSVASRPANNQIEQCKHSKITTF